MKHEEIYELHYVNCIFFAYMILDWYSPSLKLAGTSHRPSDVPDLEELYEW